MTEKDRAEAEGVFNAIFKRPSVVKLDSCNEDNDTLAFDNGLSIRLVRNYFKVRSILGEAVVDGYVVEKSVFKNNYPHAPDDMDYAEVGLVRHLREAIKLAVMTYADCLAESELDNLIVPDSPFDL
jgi:hypothetical protein